MKKKRIESQKPDFKSHFGETFFPTFHFSFCHKTPHVAKTCVEYEASYDHWAKEELTLHRTIWDNNRRKSRSFGGEQKDDVEIERCYNRCKQSQNTINKCDACFLEETGILGFKAEDAWKLFYDHATFEEIITPTANTRLEKPRYDLYSLFGKERETLPRNPCVGSLFSDGPVCKLATCPEKIINTPISGCKCYYEYCKKWLHASRDNQDYFVHRLKKESGFEEATMIFMRVLHSARWHVDKKERETARNLLLEHLIPTQIDHKTGTLPHYKILVPLREVLCQLAGHMSRKCKSEYLQGEDLGNPDVMENLIIWAEENDVRIFNIAFESKESVMHLIEKPADYANEFMARHYNISIRTLKKSLKSSVGNLTRLY